MNYKKVFLTLSLTLIATSHTQAMIKPDDDEATAVVSSEMVKQEIDKVFLLTPHFPTAIEKLQKLYKKYHTFSFLIDEGYIMEKMKQIHLYTINCLSRQDHLALEIKLACSLNTPGARHYARKLIQEMQPFFATTKEYINHRLTYGGFNVPREVRKIVFSIFKECTELRLNNFIITEIISKISSMKNLITLGTEIQELIEDGLDINAPGQEKTLLHEALIRRNKPLIRFLLKHKADATLPDENGITAYDIAVQENILDFLDSCYSREKIV